MSITPNYVPRPLKTLNVFLVVNDGEKALKFYNNAFGAEIIEKLTASDGAIHHAQIQIDDTIIMMTENKHDPAPVSGIILYLYTGDVEGLMESAIMAGAEKLKDIETAFYGDRVGMVRDPFGVTWAIATHMEDVTSSEIHRRFNEMYSRNTSQQ